jgi:hypothetical protein
MVLVSHFLQKRHRRSTLTAALPSSGRVNDMFRSTIQMRQYPAFLLASLLVQSGLAIAETTKQQQDEVPFEEPEQIEFRVSGEVKTHYRWSEEDDFPLTFFPEDFAPVGRESVEMRTPSPGSSFEVSKASVFLEADFPRSIFARVKIDFIDLYDRNPTSGDRNVDVDEVYVRFGEKYESLEAIPDSHFYALFGKAPKFERQLFRRLESYGLVQTAFNRFPDVQLQLGGSLGSNFYFRAQVSNGNPIFMRDPNVLAGDNGVEPPPNPDLTFNSGFPILYHAEVEDVAFDGKMEGGIGAGVRFLSADQEKGVDLMGFYYWTTLSESTPLNGTFYEGDLDLLDGAGESLPIDGDERREWGFNADIIAGGLGIFFQYVDEEAASLPRTGLELEIGYGIDTGDRADPGALFTVVEPVFRYSRLDNDFTAPFGFVAPSVFWDWTKIDLGVRIRLIQGADLTIEYSLHDIEASKEIGHDEFLTTLRFRFP